MRIIKSEKNGNKKKIIIIFIIVAVLVSGVSYFLFRNNNGGWICKNGEWIAEGKTDKPKPQTACFGEGGDQKKDRSDLPDKESIEADSKKVAEGINIRVSAPTVNATIKSPVKISGEAKGWYFEATFPIKIVDEKNNILGEGTAKATKDWMKDSYIPFEAEIKFDPKSSKRGNIIFEKSNPSGKPENAGSFSFPVFLEK